MATQDASTGLLSKVARFVRNPGTDWADLGKVESAPETESSKQALKYMIERKRRNDGVRRREFDQLRKLRQTHAAFKPEIDPGQAEFRASTGHSDLEERAVTLKKIDEIEAQMSRQWWKGRPGGPATISEEEPSTAAKLKRSSDRAAAADGGTSFASTQASLLKKDSEDAPTQMWAPTGSDFLQSAPAIPNTPSAATPADAHSDFSASVSSVFSSSKMMSVDMGQNLSDPEMEEAAIRFANGDDEGAQAVLMTALNAPDISTEVADGWAAALFDLYRGTGQQASFDHLAMDYAQRFGRSAPTWFSTPQLLGLECALAPVAPPVKKSAADQAPWVCPAELDEAGVAKLRAYVSARVGLCRLDWSQLRSMSAGAAQHLSVLFAQWCDQPLSLSFEAVEALTLLLQADTPVNDSTVPSYWWQLRLDAMRLLRLPDEFELVALDFCVTYELSPPSWVAPRGERVSPATAQAQAAPVGSGLAAPQAAASKRSFAEETESWALGASADQQMALSGDLLGDVEQVTSALQTTVLGHTVCVVSCAKLIRVDFAAAGSLLNWVATVEATGGHIEFRDVPRLVAAFFNLIGINEHARVSPRSN